MPGSDHGPSIKNPHVYEALRRKGMSKRRAAMISNAQRHKDSGTANLAIPPHGPDALFNQPSMAQRRRRKRTKAFNWGAHVGQAIAGRLTRGEGGRFAGNGQASTAPKPSASRERRTALRAARQERMDAIRAAREQALADEDKARADEDSYIAAGKTGHDRQLRRAEIAAKRRERARIRRETQRKAIADERAKRAEEDAAPGEEAAAAAEEKPKKGGGGGGGKKKPTDEEKRAAADQKKASNRQATAPKAGLSTEEAEWLAGVASGTPPPGSFDGRHLAELGLTQDAGDTTEATDAGRRALSALERGDVRGALAAIQDGKAKLVRDRARAEQRRQREAAKRQREAERRKKRFPSGPARQTTKAQRTFGGQPRADLADSVFAGPDRSFPIKTAQDVRDAVRSLGRTKHDKAAVRRGIIRRARAIGAMDALPERWREKADQSLSSGTQTPSRAPGPISEAITKSAVGRILDAQQGQTAYSSSSVVATNNHVPNPMMQPHAHVPRSISTVRMSIAPSIPSSFSVFKDSTGADRWLAITTTAYEDKDREFITRKAIRGVVAAGDAGAPRGPLRFWHVPGLDLGDCDYQATAFGDRFLIESGTFRSPAAARIGQKAAARGYQMSPGFLHTHQEPRGGSFDHIALFERSFVPPGRASNPYTRLLTKEARMLTPEKQKEFEALAGDPEGKALLEQLLTQAQTTTKTADDAGAVYKDAPAWAQALIARVESFEERLKALPPVAAADEEAAAADDDLAALETETADDGMGMDDEGFADLLVQKLLAALGPMLDLEKKVAGYLDSMKGMLQPMQQKDDARAQELAALTDANAALERRLKALEGDQPRVRTSLAAGVWGDLSGIPVTKEQAAQLAAKPAGEAPAGISDPIEADAYKLIYGDS